MIFFVDFLVVLGLVAGLGLVDGEMYSWGENSNGKLGVGDDVDRLVPTKIPIDFKVRQIACGDFHTAVLSGLFQFQLFLCFQLISD